MLNINRCIALSSRDICRRKVDQDDKWLHTDMYSEVTKFIQLNLALTADVRNERRAQIARPRRTMYMYLYIKKQN